MTLHLSQIFFTDALTFINQFSVLSCQFSATATAFLRAKAPCSDPGGTAEAVPYPKRSSYL
jgi:hypothetical protein